MATISLFRAVTRSDIASGGIVLRTLRLDKSLSLTGAATLPVVRRVCLTSGTQRTLRSCRNRAGENCHTGTKYRHSELACPERSRMGFRTLWTSGKTAIASPRARSTSPTRPRTPFLPGREDGAIHPGAFTPSKCLLGLRWCPCPAAAARPARRQRLRPRPSMPQGALPANPDRTSRSTPTAGLRHWRSC